MKYIIAVIQPDRLDDVLDRLTEKEIHLVTVSNVMGRGRQKGIAEVYRSHKEAGSLLKKVKLEIAVNEAFVQPTIDAIIAGARHRADRRRQDLRPGPARSASASAPARPAASPSANPAAARPTARPGDPPRRFHADSPGTASLPREGRPYRRLGDGGMQTWHGHPPPGGATRPTPRQLQIRRLGATMPPCRAR